MIPKEVSEIADLIAPEGWVDSVSDDYQDFDEHLTMNCPVTGQPCVTEHDEFCDDYGCARKAGIDPDQDLIP